MKMLNKLTDSEKYFRICEWLSAGNWTRGDDGGWEGD
jgi:hypothetical protein